MEKKKKCIVLIILETSSNYGDVNTIGTRQSINSRKFCWKLLQFNENKRPPYWGTWRKKSLFIKPRRPLAYDKVNIFIVNKNRYVLRIYSISLGYV